MTSRPPKAVIAEARRPKTALERVRFSRMSQASGWGGGEEEGALSAILRAEVDELGIHAFDREALVDDEVLLIRPLANEDHPSGRDGGHGLLDGGVVAADRAHVHRGCFLLAHRVEAVGGHRQPQETR